MRTNSIYIQILFNLLIDGYNMIIEFVIKINQNNYFVIYLDGWWFMGDGVVGMVWLGGEGMVGMG